MRKLLAELFMFLDRLPLPLRPAAAHRDTTLVVGRLPNYALDFLT